MPGKCDYHAEWKLKKEFHGWLTEASSVKKAKCLVCKKEFALGNKGIINVWQHHRGIAHKKNLNAAKTSGNLPFTILPSTRNKINNYDIMAEDISENEQSTQQPQNISKQQPSITLYIDKLLRENNIKVTMSNQVPSIGKPAPSFTATAVLNGNFKEVSLQDYKGKYLVLFFYPLDFTFVCPTEIIAFSERVEEFRNIGCEVVACSTDSHFSHLAWINTDRKEGGLGEMSIPILADKNMEISRAYGVLKEDDGVAFRGLFIIDEKQNLRQVTINDLPVGRDVDETLRLVQAFKFTDEHGEVCPAGWKPGSKTMKADPEGSKDYFASQN